MTGQPKNSKRLTLLTARKLDKNICLHFLNSTIDEKNNKIQQHIGLDNPIKPKKNHLYSKKILKHLVSCQVFNIPVS